MPERQQEQVITSLLKIKAQDASGADASLANRSFTLSTKGSKARVILNPSASFESNILFSNKSLEELQLHLNNISNRHIKGIAKWLRVHTGRKSVEPGFATHITRKGQALCDLQRY